VREHVAAVRPALLLAGDAERCAWGARRAAVNSSKVTKVDGLNAPVSKVPPLDARLGVRVDVRAQSRRRRGIRLDEKLVAEAGSVGA